MGDVVSIAAAAQKLAPLGVEVVGIAGPPEAFDGSTMHGLAFRAGDDVQVRYRAYEGRADTVGVMFGPTGIEVVQALCRRLARSPERLIATPGPKFEQAWIHDATGHRGLVAGERLALVKGLGWATINVILKKPPVAPAPTPPKDPSPAKSPFGPGMGASLFDGTPYPEFSTDPLSGDDE
jgi:hypothetical protein